MQRPTYSGSAFGSLSLTSLKTCQNTVFSQSMVSNVLKFISVVKSLIKVNFFIEIKRLVTQMGWVEESLSYENLKLTLNASCFIPFLPSLLLLISMNVKVFGNSGSCLILLSLRTSSRSWGSFLNASSSISDIKFDVRSILLKSSWRKKMKEVVKYSWKILFTSKYECKFPTYKQI